MHRPVERLVSLGFVALVAACGSSATAPDAPSAVRATAGNAQATVSWTAPAKDGGSAVLSYEVTSKPGGLSAKVSASKKTATVTGLTNGTRYMFTVVATNKQGSSAASQPSNAVTPLAVPGAPTGVTATVSGIGEATVSWTAPADNGGSAIKSYTVTSYTSGSSPSPKPTAVTATTATIKGLANGQTYAFSVYATSAAGDGPPSPMSADVTMWNVPGAPGDVRGVPSNEAATITWTASADHGSPITGYTLVVMPGNVKRAQVASPYVFTGLANGTTYTFSIHATNAVGDGPSASTDPVLVADVPGVPTDCAAVAGVAEATVTWGPPGSDGGSAIVTYTVTTLATDGSIVGTPQTTADATTLSSNVTHLLHQGYSFMVHATNAVGDGPDCSPTDPVTPVTAPDPPTDVVASAGNGHATVSWYPPTSNGGDPVTKYIVTSWLSDGTQADPSATVDAGQTKASVTGLTDGTTYTFKVQAESDVGDSDFSEPSNAVTPDPATAVAAGQSHSCELVADGVRCWGSNNYGQLGDDTTQQRHSPVQVSGLTTGVTALAAGGQDTCAIVDGGAECWGYDNFGQLGDGFTGEDSWVPAPVTGLASGVAAIAVGLGSACAVTSDGAAQCWGHDNVGQLGDGSTSDSNVPVPVTGLTSGVTAVGLGSDALHAFACALVDGGVQCWGNDVYGQIGDDADMTPGKIPPPPNQPAPVSVTGLSNGVQALALGGQFACALLTDGSVECWGNDNMGQCGDNTDLTTSNGRATPVPVSGLTSGVTAIAAGSNHACAIVNGGVECWGWNAYGQLGNGTTTDSPVPVQVTGLTSGATAIAASGEHSCALQGGVVLCWGSNSNGELGNGTPSQSQATPVPVADSGL